MGAWGEFVTELTAIFSIMGIFSVIFVFEDPKQKWEAEDTFKFTRNISLGIIGGFILASLDFEGMLKMYAEHSWLVSLIPIGLTFSTVAMIVSYRRLKRFEQEEMIEKLAEKMGEKLGESIAKSIRQD